MLSGIVKRDPLIEVRAALRDTSGPQQRSTHKAMPNHARDCRRLSLRERQELRRKVAYHAA